ncbi:MAG: hypothetical protein KA116_13155 [Proteobacteria bacterium]|nr:hypothetical protein [Pseudomonadota bacterium]
MSKLYIRLLFVASFVIAGTGAAFSIFGLAQLFAGASASVAFMAAALEFAKLVVTGFLYRYWGHIHPPLRAYLSFAVITLVSITSIGIFGYLSNAYQKSSFSLKTQTLQAQSLNEENDRVVLQIAELRRFIDEIPRNRMSRKFEYERKYSPRINELRIKSNALLEEAAQLKLKMLNTQSKIGPIVYLAEAFGKDVDTVVKYLILIFVLVFDPLAVSLVFCLSLAIRLREKYRGNESQISGHAFSSPVDHRKIRRVA